MENALRHGNSFDPNKSIGFSLKILKTQAVITVSDDGEGFNPRELPNPRLCENFFKRSGRGVFLLKHIFRSNLPLGCQPGSIRHSKAGI